MPFASSRRRLHRSRIALEVALAALLVVASVGVAAPAHTAGSVAPPDVAATPDGVADADAAPVAPVAPDDSAGLEPSIEFEQAASHAADRTTFAPGDRVAVGFSPRPGDPWTVGGSPAVALPAGRLDGQVLRDQRAPGGLAGLQGDASAADAGSTVDVPSNGGFAVPATSTSYVQRAEPAAVATQAAVTPGGLRREIFGFLPYWELTSRTLRLDYARISTIAYFGVGADRSGNLERRNPDGSITTGWSGWTSSKMSSVIAAAHASHTRVVLTVQSFAWNATGLAQQKALLGSSTARGNLARQIAAAVRDRGADGVNLDFEPLAAGYEDAFTSLVRWVRLDLNRVHRGYQVTFDTTGRIGNYPIADATAPGGADAIFVMAYDYRTAASSPVGSVAPLDRSDAFDVRDTIESYIARVPASKVILGVPYYGRAWSTASATLNASNTSSARTGPSTTVDYATAAEYLARYGRRYDPAEEVAWTAYPRRTCTATYGCVTSWRQLYVDDAATIGQKYDLVNLYGLRGAGIWALGFDGTRPEMWHAIQVKFIDDTSAPTVAIVALPAREANPAFLVRWTGFDNVAIARYDVQVAIDGRPWSSWVTGTTATSAVWYGADGHRYAFRVRGHDPKGNVSAWNVSSSTPLVPAALARGGFGAVVAGGLSVRSAPDPGATRTGSLAVGDVVAIVGGPRVAGGYTWIQVTGPLGAWGPLRPSVRGAWVAASSGGTRYVVPAKPPNTTTVDALIGDLRWNGGGNASVGDGASAIAQRTFSPNGDSQRDTIRLNWTNAVALDGLVLRIFRADGTRVGDVPLVQRGAGQQAATWNGFVAGRRLPDGRYLAVLVGTVGGGTFYDPINSFRADAYAANRLTIDTVPPRVTSAGASRTLISPNGDGVADSVTVAMTTTDATSWAFGVAPVGGSGRGVPILARTGAGRSVTATWDGRTGSGALVPDGAYQLQLVGRDVAGNRAIRTWTVRVDRTRPGISLAAPGTFSPNADGAADTGRLGWMSREPVTGTARIYRGGTLVRSWSVRGTAGAVTWDGRTAGGTPVADGRYAFQLVGRDAAGNVTATSVAVVVDRTLSTLRWSRSSFDPQGATASARTVKLTFATTRSATVTATIYAGTTVIRRIMTNARLGAGSHAWTWDGRNGSGAIVPPGTYVVLVHASSVVGSSVLARAVVRSRTA